MKRPSGRSLTKPLALSAMIVGAALGSYGLATAATGSSSGSTSTGITIASSRAPSA